MASCRPRPGHPLALLVLVAAFCAAAASRQQGRFPAGGLWWGDSAYERPFQVAEADG
jgi:hypothetical protein